MVKKDLLHKIQAIIITSVVIFLIFSVLVPPATSVHIEPGAISGSSNVTTGRTVTFNDVNLTIRGAERIPINSLNFSIHNNANDNLVGYVEFYPDGTEFDDDPNGKFTVTNTTSIQSSWYSYGYGYGYDEHAGSSENFGYGYGYGYYQSGYCDITFLYDIVYTTHTTGTFYWKLTVNSTTSSNEHLFSNSSTATFKVTASAPSGGGAVAPPEEEEPDEVVVPVQNQSSQEVLDEITEEFGDEFVDINLSESFYANDTDGDGVLDSFTDPNGVLDAVQYTGVNGNSTVLISVNGSIDHLVLWDVESNSIIGTVDHNMGSVQSTVKDVAENKVTVTVSVDKADWVYLEIDDPYPDNEQLVVQTSDGRVISEDRIRREAGKIYVLDDPDVIYQFIFTDYFYEIDIDLSSTAVPAGDALYARVEIVNISIYGLINANMTYAVYLDDVLIWSSVEVLTSQTVGVFNVSIPTDDLEPGMYQFKVVHSYYTGLTTEESTTFTVVSPVVEPPVEGVPWIIIAVGMIAAVIIAVIILIKFGIIYFEREEEE